MNRTVLAVVTDLFFVAKIQGVARAAGVSLHVSTPADAAAESAAHAPDLIVLDLHAVSDLTEFVTQLRKGTRAPLVGFYSHVDGETRRLAIEAGVDQVLPRSAFVTRLGDILTGGQAQTTSTEEES